MAATRLRKGTLAAMPVHVRGPIATTTRLSHVTKPGNNRPTDANEWPIDVAPSPTAATESRTNRAASDRRGKRPSHGAGGEGVVRNVGDRRPARNALALAAAGGLAYGAAFPPLAWWPLAPMPICALVLAVRG